NAPAVDQITVTDHAGRTIASIGDLEVGGVQTSGAFFAEAYIGDPFGSSDPNDAILSVTPDGAVTIGRTGFVRVADPFDDAAAWIGAEFDTLPVTGAANAGGLIRLTVVGHALASGDIVRVRGVVGVTAATDGTSNANGTFAVTVVDASHVD